MPELSAHARCTISCAAAPGSGSEPRLRNNSLSIMQFKRDCIFTGLLLNTLACQRLMLLKAAQVSPLGSALASSTRPGLEKAAGVQRLWLTDKPSTSSRFHLKRKSSILEQIDATTKGSPGLRQRPFPPFGPDLPIYETQDTEPQLHRPTRAPSPKPEGLEASGVWCWSLSQGRGPTLLHAVPQTLPPHRANAGMVTYGYQTGNLGQTVHRRGPELKKKKRRKKEHFYSIFSSQKNAHDEISHGKKQRSGLAFS